MTKVVEMEISQPCFLASVSKSCPASRQLFPLVGEDIGTSYGLWNPHDDCLQLFINRYFPFFQGFRILRLKKDDPLFKVHLIPPHPQDFTFSHGSVISQLNHEFKM